eukprot:9380537-Lingulodinium_polyedra.AAC.1
MWKHKKSEFCKEIEYRCREECIACDMVKSTTNPDRIYEKMLEMVKPVAFRFFGEMKDCEA